MNNRITTFGIIEYKNLNPEKSSDKLKYNIICKVQYDLMNYYLLLSKTAIFFDKDNPFKELYYNTDKKKLAWSKNSSEFKNVETITAPGYSPHVTVNARDIPDFKKASEKWGYRNKHKIKLIIDTRVRTDNGYLLLDVYSEELEDLRTKLGFNSKFPSRDNGKFHITIGLVNAAKMQEERTERNIKRKEKIFKKEEEKPEIKEIPKKKKFKIIIKKKSE